MEFNQDADSTPATQPLTYGQIVTILDGLDRDSLTRVIIRVDKYRDDNPYHSNPTRIANLLAFVESAVGCGLGVLSDVLEELFPQVVGEARLPPVENEESTPDLDAKPREQLDVRSLVLPGGTIAFNSAFYIQRENFPEAVSLLHAPDARQLVTVSGARQTGKSTFMLAVLADAQRRGELRTVFIDFQLFSLDCFQSVASLWRTITEQIAFDLEIASWSSTSWRADIDVRQNMVLFLRQHLFRTDQTPLLLCFDEVDRVIGQPAGNEFFSYVRGFFNQATLNPQWNKIRWLLATSSEPVSFISLDTESPFNIGLDLTLHSLTTPQIQEMIQRHQQQHVISAQELRSLVGGRPYLVHLTLYGLASGKVTKAELLQPLVVAEGWFSQHLNGYRNKLEENRILNNAMWAIVRGQGHTDITICHVLRAMGLVTKDSEGKYIPCCRLYEEYFKHSLRWME